MCCAAAVGLNGASAWSQFKITNINSIGVSLFKRHELTATHKECASPSDVGACGLQVLIIIVRRARRVRLTIHQHGAPICAYLSLHMHVTRPICSATHDLPFCGEADITHMPQRL